MPRLELLWLSGNWIERIENLDAQQALAYLGLDLTLISHTGGVERLPSLRVLSIHGNDLRRIVGLQALPHLEEVRVSKGDIWGEPADNYGEFDDEGVHPVWKAKQYCAFLEAGRQEAIERTRSLFKVSELVPTELLVHVLRVSEKEFDDRIIDWCEAFGFRIHGHAIDTTGADIDAFMNWLSDNYYFWT
jgi:hypothetical protein